MPKIPNKPKVAMYGIYSQQLNEWVYLLCDPHVFRSYEWAERYFSLREKELNKHGYKIVALGIVPTPPIT